MLLGKIERFSHSANGIFFPGYATGFWMQGENASTGSMNGS